MEELMRSLPQSHAFVYPWTRLSGEDVDSIVTGSIIYDRLYYLDYKLPSTRNLPLFQGVEHLSNHKRIGYQGVLQILSDRGRLVPLSAEDIRNSVRASSGEHHYDTFAKTCLRYRNILRQKGFSSQARMKELDTVYLADEKIDSTLRTALAIDSSDQRPGEIRTSWENVASVVAGYADYVVRSRNASPFGLDPFHSEVLQVLLRKEAEPLHDAGVVLRNLLELPIPSISETWTLDISRLNQVLDEIKATRMKAFVEIEKYLDECVSEDNDSAIDDTVCEVTYEIIPKLKDIEEQVAQYARKENQTSRLAKLMGYIAGGTWFTVAFMQEELRSLAGLGGPVKDEATNRMDIWLKKRKKNKIQSHQFCSTHCFLEHVRQLSV